MSEYNRPYTRPDYVPGTDPAEALQKAWKSQGGFHRGELYSLPALNQEIPSADSNVYRLSERVRKVEEMLDRILDRLDQLEAQ